MMMMMIHLNTAYPPLSLSFPLVLKYQGCQIAKSNKKDKFGINQFQKGTNSQKGTVQTNALAKFTTQSMF